MLCQGGEDECIREAIQQIEKHVNLIVHDPSYEIPKNVFRLRQAQFSGIIFIRSANDDPLSVKMYIEAGADGCLSKGVGVVGLARKVVEGCERAWQMRGGL